MKRMGFLRDVLWDEGSELAALIGGLALVIVFIALPWVTAEVGYITLLNHYLNFGKTISWLNYFMAKPLVDAAFAFLITLIALPLAIWWAFTNKPVISGILSITSGVSLIYVFKVTQASGALPYLLLEFDAGFKPYNIGVGTYGIIVIGGFLLLSYYRHKRSEG